jgi:2-dehydro-3-deoxyphosphogalactonate aldolase
MTPDPLVFRLPLVAILRGIRPEETLAHVGALVEEGYDAIEIPLNSPGWRDSIALARRDFGARAAIGAGTVLREAEVDALVEIGAPYIVTPNTRPALIAHAVQSGLQVMAGFATASEGLAALDAGAQMLKLFPASVYGPALVRALRSVLPPVPLFAVGGVGPSAVKDFISAGCTGVGIGGELYKAGQTLERTRSQARAFRAAYAECMP